MEKVLAGGNQNQSDGRKNSGRATDGYISYYITLVICNLSTFQLNLTTFIGNFMLFLVEKLLYYNYPGLDCFLV